MVDLKKLPAVQSLPNEGDFIIVEFEVKEKRMYYIVKVIVFLKRSNKIPNNFHMTNAPDIATVAKHDIKIFYQNVDILTTKRKQQCIYMDFLINLR